MTDKERAVIMAHTGYCMLTGEKFQIFHKYVEDIMGRPITTFELGFLADTIKEKTKADFIALCEDKNGSENSSRWISVSDRLPNSDEYVKNNGLFIVSDGNRSYSEWYDLYGKKRFGEPTMNGFCIDYAVIAWMSLPEPCKESEDKE